MKSRGRREAKREAERDLGGEGLGCSSVVEYFPNMFKALVESLATQNSPVNYKTWPLRSQSESPACISGNALPAKS